MVFTVSASRKLIFFYFYYITQEISQESKMNTTNYTTNSDVCNHFWEDCKYTTNMTGKRCLVCNADSRTMTVLNPPSKYGVWLFNEGETADGKYACDTQDYPLAIYGCSLKPTLDPTNGVVKNLSNYHYTAHPKRLNAELLQYCFDNDLPVLQRIYLQIGDKDDLYTIRKGDTCYIVVCDTDQDKQILTNNGYKCCTNNYDRTGDIDSSQSSYESSGIDSSPHMSDRSLSSSSSSSDIIRLWHSIHEFCKYYSEEDVKLVESMILQLQWDNDH